METPYWALSLIYWLHMLATVVWIGSLAALALLFLPAAQQALPGEAYAGLLARLQRRLDPLGWISLAVLLGTGLFQMSANPNYEGLLAVTNRWAVAILIKHLVFLGMGAISAYLTWGLLPQIQRAALRQAAGQAAPEQAALGQRQARLLRLNLVLGIVVLALTALARAA